MTQYLNEVIQKISESVQFDSSLKKGTKGMPFGEGAANCLKHFLSLAESLGFETKNYDNYIGEVIFGKGPEEFAILCHLDVVPAGNGWTKPPFGGVVEDGKIWGRGTTDDKGPAICSLYALKILMDEGFIPSKRIKLIVGCNEEQGWRCIEHYNKVATMPDTGFSPDADFPVIYAEKGILHLRLHFPIPNAPFLFFQGGERANMVCDRCESIPHQYRGEQIKELGLELKSKKLISHGKSAHASTPELGENAILPMLRYYAEKCPDVDRVIKCVFDDVFGLKMLSDGTGILTMSPNVIKYRKGDLCVTVDIRYPVAIPLKTVLEHISQFDVQYEVVHSQDPLYHDKSSRLVQTLLEAYEECTGIVASPLAIGGGTYARALKNGVGFGPEIPGEDSHIHQADEFISIDRIELLLKVYKRAIEWLTN